MKRFLFLFLLLILINPEVSFAQKVLLVIKENSPQQEYMLTHEVGKMLEIMKKEGIGVVTATISGEVLRSKEITVRPDHKVADIKMNDYDGLLIPCMTIDLSDPVFMALAKDAVRQEKPVAAQAGSVMIIARAGLLAGKKYALNIDMSNDPDFGAGQYAGRGVVRDGNILTSGICPWLAKSTGDHDGTEELTLMLVDAVKHRSK